MKKFTLVIALMLSLTGTFATPQALAMPDASIITANCRAAQSVISQIEKANAVSRINRGWAYDNTLSLLFAMNTRLSNDQIAAPRLVELTSDFKAQSATFRSSHDRYATELARAVNVDCVQKPIDFYARLITARGHRQTVADEIKKLDRIIDDYKNELNKIAEDLK
jgi:hypothetical protein